MKEWKWTGSLDLYSLSRQEQELVSSVRNLSQKWGYRAGPDSDHTLFERKLITPKWKEIYTLTTISDPLFRTLQQGKAYDSDVLSKFYCPFWLTEDRKRADLARQFLQTFLATDKQVFIQMNKLAQAQLNQGKSSWWFVILCTSAKILMLIAEGKFKSAEQLTRDMREAIDHHQYYHDSDL